MADIDVDKLATEVARRIFQQSLSPVPRLFVNDTITETDGARDVLRDIWQHPDSGRIQYVQVGFSPASAAGVYRTDGPGVQNSVGQPIPAGGAVLYLQSATEVRQLRVQCTTPGSTMILTATAFLAGNY